jgi:stage III sporulation protein AE
MPQADSFGEGLLALIANAIGQLHPDLREAAGICLSLIGVIMLVSIAGLIPGARLKTAEFVGAVGIGTILLQSTNTLIRLGSHTIEEMSAYGKLLLPVMTAAMAGQGGISTSAALYAGTAAFDALLTSIVGKLLTPLVYIYLILAVANSAVGEDVLQKIGDTIKWAATWSLKTILYVYTGYIGVTGVISGSADAAAIKAAKLAISGVVPVVGSILSDASEAVLISAGTVKNAAGIYGLFAILAIWIGPFLQIGSHYLLLKATAVVCSVFSSKSSTKLVQNFCSALGLLLAMTGAICLMLFISLVCFLKGVA